MALNLGSLDVFNQIYRDNIWGDGKGSGIGSDPVHVRPYTQFLQNFLQQNQIKSVVDLGCGDWQFSRELNLEGIEYLGVDVATSVIESNQKEFQASNVSFSVLREYSQLPKSDLLICKDVLMHLGHEEVFKVIREAFPKFRQILITSDVNPYSALGDAYLNARNMRQKMFNEDILTGQMTPFDIRMQPYNIPGEKVFSWTLPYDSLNQRLHLANAMAQGNRDHESRLKRLLRYPARLAQALLLRDCQWRKDCVLITQSPR